MQLPTEISVLTLNCWGLKYLAKLRRERLAEIGRQIALADPRPDLVALQELWTQEDFRAIRRVTRAFLPFAKFYNSALLGAGLAIFSRWPIEESSMYRYPLNGRPTAFFRGDWYVGKGVACAKIRYGPASGHVIEVLNTHTHAPYESGPNDSYLCHRIAQAWAMSKLMRAASERGHLVIALGDFNMIPLSLEYQIITAHAPVRDVWRVLHPDSSLGPSSEPAERARGRPVPTAEHNITENGACSDGPYNTWRWPAAKQKLLGPGKPEVDVPPYTPDPRGKRLDYVFASQPALGGRWLVKRANVGMMMRHPTLGCSLSDHFAVEATLSFHAESEPALPPSLVEKRRAAVPALVSQNPHITVTIGGETAFVRGSDHTALSPLSSLPLVKQHDVLYPPPPQPSQQGAVTSIAGRSLRTMSSDNDDVSSVVASELPVAGAPGNARRRSEFRMSKSFFDSLTELEHEQADEPPPKLAGPMGMLPLSTYDEILAIISQYEKREQSQRFRRAAHFFFWVAMLVACLVGAWWAPGAEGGGGAVAFVLVLVSSLGLAAGTVDGLMALLFFTSELAALREFEWEIMNARVRAAGAAGWTEEMSDEEEPPKGW